MEYKDLYFFFVKVVSMIYSKEVKVSMGEDLDVLFILFEGRFFLGYDVMGRFILGREDLR